MWIRPNSARIRQIPPINTFSVYQVETLGSPNESIADNKNKASNTANPLRRFENDALLLRLPLEKNIYEILRYFVDDMEDIFF